MRSLTKTYKSAVYIDIGDHVAHRAHHELYKPYEPSSFQPCRQAWANHVTPWSLIGACALLIMLLRNNMVGVLLYNALNGITPVVSNTKLLIIYYTSGNSLT
jgi:hypothetical protein